MEKAVELANERGPPRSGARIPAPGQALLGGDWEEIGSEVPERSEDKFDRITGPKFKARSHVPMLIAAIPLPRGTAPGWISPQMKERPEQFTVNCSGRFFAVLLGGEIGKNRP